MARDIVRNKDAKVDPHGQSRDVAETKASKGTHKDKCRYWVAYDPKANGWFVMMTSNKDDRMGGKSWMAWDAYGNMTEYEKSNTLI